MASAVFGVVTTVVLARLLGPSEYGIFAFAMALVGLLGIPAKFGLPGLVVRQVAAYEQQSGWAMLRGLLIWANRGALALSLALAAATAATLSLWPGLVGTGGREAIWIALPILPVAALGALRAATLRGLHHVALSHVPDGVIRPIALVVLVVAGYLVIGPPRFDAVWALGFELTASMLAFGVGGWLLLTRLPSGVRTSAAAYRGASWAHATVPFAIVASMQFVNHRADVLFLGFLKGPESVGLYQAAARIADTVQFALITVNAVLAPTVSRLWAARDLAQMQRVVTSSARIALALALPTALALMLAPATVLGVVFGASYAAAAPALVILAGAQLVNAGMGSVALLLTMTGHEWRTAFGVGGAAVLNVGLSLVMIPPWGISGAAVATAVTLVAWNLLLFFWVMRTIGIHSSALGRVRRPA